ncbi:MAG: VOC family protein, partial [Pseudomonadota bacterium]
MRDFGLDLDHIGLWCSDVEAGARLFSDVTSVETQDGGSHAGQGTCNRLVGAKNSQYVELIGRDPKQNVEGAIIQQVGSQHSLTSCLLAYRTSDLESLNATVLHLGGRSAGVQSMQRAGADGLAISWRLLFISHPDHPILPFFIDWGSAPHPSTRLAPAVEVCDPTFLSKSPDALHNFLTKLGVSASVTQAPEHDLHLSVKAGGQTFLASK